VFAQAEPIMRAPLVSLLVLALCLLAGAGPGHAQNVPAPEGWSALEAGDGSKAASVFRQALEIDPGNPYLLYGAGMAAHLLGRDNDALSSLKKAVASEPRFVEAHLWLGQIAYAQGDLDLAVRSFEAALKLRPGNRQIASQLEAWRKESGVHRELTDRVGVRFRILFDGTRQQALGDRVERVLESGYWRLGKLLDSYPAETITVVLYTNRQFSDITRAPAWAGGAYDGRIRLPAGGALRTPAEFDRVVTHELVHAIVASATRGGEIPAWINEGLASHLESGSHAWVDAVITRTRAVIPLEQLEQPFGNLDSQLASVAYAESALAARLLVERLGPNLGLFLQMVGSGTAVDDALTTLKVDAAAFRAEWKRRIGLR
jgi:tetratricopeptide (TPR) repeat protein